jgi:glutamyl-tRNA synthetase
MDMPNYDLALLVGNSLLAAQARAALADARDRIADSDSDFADVALRLDHELRAIADQHKIAPEDLFRTMRVALCGRLASPGLYEAMAALGKQETLERLGKALRALGDRA